MNADYLLCYTHYLVRPDIANINNFTYIVCATQSLC